MINNGNWTNWGECNLGWNHTRDFQIEWARSASSIWNHKYDFRPKLHNTRFNYHFITSILKSPKYRTWSFQTFYWCSTERDWNKIHPFWGGGEGGEVRVLETKVAKFATWYSVFHFSAIWSVTLNKPWNLIGCFVFSVASSLHWFMNKSHQLEPIRLQGPPVISKWT